MLKHTFSKDILFLLALSLLIFVLNLWGYPLFDVDEPRYAETAREMLTSPGDWITPHFNWMVRFDKPALFYWMIAGAYKLLGVSAFSARLVSALMATLLVVMLYAFIRNQIGRKAGLMSAVVFATMLEVYALARWSVTDMTLATFMGGTWICLFYVIHRHPRWYVPAGIFAGLGMLTKGPVALVLPGFTMILALALFNRDRWNRLWSPWILAGLGLFTAIALPWYWAVTVANPHDFIQKFFFLHNVERFSGTVSGHAGTWYYYVPVLIAGAFPWTLFLPGLLNTLYTQRKQLPPAVAYSALWFAVVFLFFSLSGTKLLTYILPAFAPFAVLMGWYWHRQLLESQDAPGASEARKRVAWINRGLWLGFGIAAVLCYVTVAQPYKLVPKAVHMLFNPLYAQVASVILLLTLAVTLILNSRTDLRLRSFQAFSTGIVGLLVFANWTLMPMAAGILQNDVMAFARRSVADNVPIATYGMKKPSLVFYTQRKVHFIPSIHADKSDVTDSATPLHAQLHALYLVVKNKDLPEVHSSFPVRLVQPGTVYSLVQVDHPNLTQEINQ